MKRSLREYTSVPNLLCYFRIFLILPFLLSYIVYRDFVVSIVCVALSAVSDVLDGIIARKFNQCTEWGKIMDPLADKLSHIAVAACLLSLYSHMLPVLLLLCVKEAFQGFGSWLLYHKTGQMRPSEWFGKLSTVVFYGVALFLLVFRPAAGLLSDLLILLSGCMLLLAFALYIYRFVTLWNAYRASLKENASLNS